MWEETKEVQSIFEPEPPPLDELLTNEKASLRKSAAWEIGLGSFVVLLHFTVFAYLIFYQVDVTDSLDEPLSWKFLFRSIFFIFGLIAIVGGIWGLYRAKHLTIDEIVPSPVAVEFLREAEAVTPYFTYIMIGGLVVVMLLQIGTGVEESIVVAGFVKPDFFYRNEYWRLFSGSVMHGGILHIYFNAMAFLGFGSLIEKLSNRAHLSIVFVLSAIGGGLLSFLFMPHGTSVGASGGIMGFMGYLAIFGYRRKDQLPSTFLKSMLINVAFIGAIGIIGFQLIDNFAHLGGLLVGVAYGFMQIPTDQNTDSRRVDKILTLFGYVAIIFFIGICVFTLLKITNQPLYF